jgi:hypothetical protein
MKKYETITDKELLEIVKKYPYMEYKTLLEEGALCGYYFYTKENWINRKEASILIQKLTYDQEDEILFKNLIEWIY